MATHDEVFQKKYLPRVGQSVRNKKYGTLWRVIEKREMWTTTDDDPKTGDPRLLPAIYLCYWKVEEGKVPGVGKMLGFAYTLLDNTFEMNWEILN